MQSKMSYFYRIGLFIFPIFFSLLLGFGSCRAPEKVVQSAFQRATNIRMEAFQTRNFAKARADLQGILAEQPGDLEVRVIKAVTYIDEYLLAVNNENAGPSEQLFNQLTDELLTVNKGLIGDAPVQSWVEPTLHNAFATALLLDSKNRLSTAETEESLGIVYAQLFATEEIAQNVLNYVAITPVDSLTPGLLRAKKTGLDNLIAAKNGQLEALTMLFGISNATATAEKDKLMDETYGLLTNATLEVKEVPPAYSFWNFDAFKYLQLSDAEFFQVGKALSEMQELCALPRESDGALPAEVSQKQQQIIDFAKKTLAHEILGLRLAKKELKDISIKLAAWQQAYDPPCGN